VHAIEKIISCFDETLIKSYYDIILDNFQTLANDSYGLGVVKKVIIHAQNPEIKNKTHKLLITHALVLVQNPYGNYALQMAIDVILYLNLFRLGVNSLLNLYLKSFIIIFKVSLSKSIQVMFLKNALNLVEV
jgi:hypothetical protein